MQKYCPQCRGVFEAQFLCPTCGVMLQEGGDTRSITSSAAGEGCTLPSISVAQRLLAGLVVAQGGYFALLQASTGLAEVGGFTDLFAASSPRIALQACTLILGALVSGAGNASYLLTGITVGFINALFLLGSQFASGIRPLPTTILAMSGASTAVGLVGAWIGSRYWPSLATFQPVIRAKAVKAKSTEPKEQRPPVPIAWFRILGGAALSIGCTVWAGPIRDFVVQNSHGAFGVDSRIQLQFTAWIISTLAMMIGGAFAGASSRGGIRHGFLVGLLASVGVFVIHLKIVKEVLPAQRFFEIVVGLPESETPTASMTGLFLLTNTLLIGILGGFFGSKLLPRIIGGPSALDRGAI